MPWRKPETWVVAILVGLIASYLDELLNVVVPLVLAWFVSAGIPADVGAVLLASGSVWGAEKAKRSEGGYSLGKHYVYTFEVLAMPIVAPLLWLAFAMPSPGYAARGELPLYPCGTRMPF